MRSLIVDFHAGCIQSLQSTLEKSGHETHIISYSQHNFVIQELIDNPKMQPEKFSQIRISLALFGLLGFFKKFQTANLALKRRKWLFKKTRYDIVWCCFPPGIYRNITSSGVAKQTVVVISHRMDMGISKFEARANFWNEVKHDLELGKTKFVAANQYDAKYFEYYTKTIIPVIDIQTSYVIKSENFPKLPVLIGPSHVSSDMAFVREIKRVIPNVQTIKESYSTYTHEQLSLHKAFILLPYSTYSISLLELSNLGAPILVPSDDFLLKLGLLNDVMLFPLYGSQEEIRRFEESCNSNNPGPNCDCSPCRKYWLQFAFWKTLPNIVYWDSLTELATIVSRLNNSQRIQPANQPSIKKVTINEIC